VAIRPEVFNPSREAQASETLQRIDGGERRAAFEALEDLSRLRWFFDFHGWIIFTSSRRAMMMLIPAAPRAADRITASQSGGVMRICGIFIDLISG
jgi:hypothetical protein